MKTNERLRDVFLLLPLVFGLESDFLRGPGPANTGSCRRGPRRFCFFLPNPNTRIKSPKIYRQYLVKKTRIALTTITASNRHNGVQHARFLLILQQAKRP
ncbi:MAG: hypothetical protein ABJM26_10530 [Anderseniella sp.]